MIDNSTLRRFPSSLQLRRTIKTTSTKIYIMYSVLLLILCGCASNTDLKTAPESINIDKLYSQEELKEDLDYLFQTMENVHPNLYFHTANEIINNDRYNLEQLFTRPQTALEFWKLASPLVSKLGDGHTGLYLPRELWNDYTSNSGLIVPFEVYIDDFRLFVKTNGTNDSTFSINSEILSINSTPSIDIINSLIERISGERFENRIRRIEWSFAYYVLAFYGFDNQFHVEYFSNKDSLKYFKYFNGITLDSLINQKNIAQKIEPYTSELLDKESIGIIDFNSFRDLKQFKKFCQTTFQEIQNNNIQNLIIDIRQNGGGKSSLGDHLLGYLTDKPFSQTNRIEIKASKEARKRFREKYFKWYLYPLYPLVHFFPFSQAIFTKKIGTTTTVEFHPGKSKENDLRFNDNIYLLTDGITFSSATLFASAFQCYKLGTIIGEETGGLTASFRDVIYFELPNTELWFPVSSKYWVNACSKEDGHGVIPDYEVKQTPEDRAKGIDTVMEFTKQLIKENEVAKN